MLHKQTRRHERMEICHFFPRLATIARFLCVKCLSTQVQRRCDELEIDIAASAATMAEMSAGAVQLSRKVETASSPER